MKYENLKILDELRQKGSITEEEYQREKAKILNEESNVLNGTAQKPLFGLEENTYLMLMHLAQFGGYLLPLFGFVLPILMWITNKNTNENVDKHGKNILNFIISFLIYYAVAGILVILLIGIPLLVVLAVLQFVFIIMAAIKANSGIYWKYPVTIEFFK